MISATMGILNNHTLDNVDVEVYPSDYPSEYNSASVPDTDNTPINYIDCG